MGEFATLLAVVLAGLIAYRQAKARGEWSWRSFGWTLSLVIVYVAVSVAAGFGLDALVGSSDPLVRTLCIIVPIAIGVVPLAIVAKKIQVRDTSRSGER